MASGLYRRDGCRAWMVCFCSVLSCIFVFGSIQNFGLIYPSLLDEFKEGKAKTAWIGSLAGAFTMLISPLAAKLINRFGARPVSFVGGFVAALGLFLTSLGNSMPVMYVTFSVIYGMGTCVIYTTYYDIVPKYFKKRLAIATGVLSSGAATSNFVMSPIMGSLITNMGWRNACKVLSGFAIVAGMLGLSFSPHVEKDVSPPQTQRRVMVVREEIEKKSLKRNGCFIIICLYSFTFQLGNTIPLLHLGRFAQDSGLTPSQTANLYTGFGIASMIGRLLAGKICEFKFVNPSYVLCFFTLIAGTSTIVCPSVNTFIGLMIYFCTNGFCDGFHVTLKNFILMVECSAEQRTTAFGCLFFVTALAWGVGSPFGGFIADETGSYIPTFYTSGAIVLFSAGIIIFTKCLKKKNKTELELLDEEDYMIERVTVV